MTTNLSGSLSEFSLAEVLSLLGMGGRTARMQVTSLDAVGTVHLVEGRISTATADSTRAGLLRHLVAALPVPADDLAHALQADDPVRALVDAGVVDREAAGQVAAEHCTEAVGTMLEWTSGEFAVWVGSEDPSDIGVRLEVDELVGAARERAQEWHDLRAALPAPESVLALVAEVASAPVVDREDWAVLARVDGRRTLAEVLAAMGASPLAAGSRLVELLGRGLVAVRVDGGEAEKEHAHELIDAYEVGAPVGPVDEGVDVAAPVGPVDEGGDVAAPEPETVPEVHDLFVTEPEAVEEWQVTAVEAWEVAEPETLVDDSVAAEVEPRTYELEPVDFATEAAAFDVGSALHEPEAVAFAAEPAAHVLDPVAPENGFEPVAMFAVESAADEEAGHFAPVTFEVEPAASPVAFEVETVAAPVAFEAEPVAPVAESFAWSPWAQEMGLGEAPPVAQPAPEPVGQGFADMVEDGAPHGHTDALPVPQSPFAGADVGYGLPVEVGGEVGQFVPQPRDPGDGLVDPSAHADPVGAHAASPAPLPATGVQAEADPAVDPAPDPLAGGLLAHLMSSVRGL